MSQKEIVTHKIFLSLLLKNKFLKFQLSVFFAQSFDGSLVCLFVLRRSCQCNNFLFTELTVTFDCCARLDLCRASGSLRYDETFQIRFPERERADHRQASRRLLPSSTTTEAEATATTPLYSTVVPIFSKRKMFRNLNFSENECFCDRKSMIFKKLDRGESLKRIL